MRSDLPRSRPRGARGHQLGRRRARRARRARAETARRRPDTCRQSSIAHTRSPSRPRAHTSSAANPARADLDRLSPTSSPSPRATRRERVRALVRVRPEHDHGPRPPLARLQVDARRTRLAAGRCHAPYLCRDPRQAPVRASVDGAGVGGAWARLVVRVVCARAPSLISVRGPAVRQGRRHDG